jgi:hypothetical protein
LALPTAGCFEAFEGLGRHERYEGSAGGEKATFWQLRNEFTMFGTSLPAGKAHERRSFLGRVRIILAEHRRTGLFDRTAKQMKVALGISEKGNLRDKLSMKEIAFIAASEALAT